MKAFVHFFESIISKADEISTPFLDVALGPAQNVQESTVGNICGRSPIEMNLPPLLEPLFDEFLQQNWCCTLAHFSSRCVGGNQCAWPSESFACPSSDWIPSSSSNNRSSSNRVTITADRLSAPSTTSCARWCRNSRRPRARICQLPGYLWEDWQLVSVTTFIILLFIFLFSFLNDLTQFLQFEIFLFPFMDLTQFFLGMKSLRLPYHFWRGYCMNSSHLLCLIYFNRDLVEQLSLFIFKLASSTFSLESLFLIAIFTSATKISLCNSFRQR